MGRIRLQQEHRRRRETAPVHRHELRVGSCALPGRQDQHLGTAGLRMGDLDFKARSHDGYGEDWPIGYADIAPYYDRVDRLLGISGVAEHLPYLPDSIFQRPYKLNAAEVHCARRCRGMGRTRHAVPGRRDHDGLVHNKYRTKCYGRGACSRRAGGCDIHAAFDSPTGLIYPAQDTAASFRTNATAQAITVDPATGKARGVAFVDTETRRDVRGAGAHGGRGRLDPGIGAPAAAFGVAPASRLDWQLERACRPQLLRAPDGPECDRTREGSRSARPARSTTGGRAASTCRASAMSASDGRTSSAPMASKGAAARRCSPITPPARRDSARRSRRRCATAPAPSSAWAASARCCRATRTASALTRR